MPGIPFPKPISAPPFVPDPGPTYTQIFNDTMGDLGTDADGFPAMFAELQALSTAFGVELTADQAIGPIAVLGGIVGILDPAPLDVTIGNYVAAMPVGDGVLTDIGNVTEPPLLTLPITPGDGSTAFLPPSQLTQDFGTVKLGSAAQGFQVGSYVENSPTGETGDLPKGFIVPAAPFTVWTNSVDFAGGTETRVTWGITMTPLVTGQFTAQFEYVQHGNHQLVILTLTVNVTA